MVIIMETYSMLIANNMMSPYLFPALRTFYLTRENQSQDILSCVGNSQVGTAASNCSSY